MKKTAIAPIVAVVASAIAIVFHKQIPNDIQNVITDVSFVLLTAGFQIYGIFKNHKKDGEKK